MSHTDAELAKLVEHGRQTFGELYESLRFPSRERALSAEGDRTRRLRRITSVAGSLCGDTKFVFGSLPPGCRLCVEGTWSCLLMNGACDAGCFFCPKPKETHTLPTSDGMAFPTVAEYVAYLRTLGFRGVGISGGEPLLSLERTLEFIAGIKEQFQDAVHIWLYTSGLHATKNTLRELQAAGLDEIRFNIAADGYNLDPLKRAAGLFKSVVVEIPAVPEDAPLLSGLLPALAHEGVRCVNLHQMWCSPQNGPALVARDYTFLHGARISVLESEQAALGVLEHAMDSDPGVPVHYCSSAFKGRFQTTAALRRDARLVARNHEEITAAGLVRILSVGGTDQELAEQRRRFEAAGGTAADYTLDQEEGRLYFRAFLWEALDLQRFTPRLTYEIVFRPASTDPPHSVLEIPITAERTLRLKRLPVEIVPAMSKGHQDWFRERVVKGDEGPGGPGLWGRLHVYETLETGLPPYA